MSFLKYSDNDHITGGNGRGPLSFARAHVDGMPYRGPKAMLRDEEWQEYTETVQDGGADQFDLSDPEQKAALQEIVDAASNGWFQIYRMTETMIPQPDGGCKTFVFCVWSAPHKELAKHRVPAGLLQSPQRLG